MLEGNCTFMEHHHSASRGCGDCNGEDCSMLRDEGIMEEAHGLRLSRIVFIEGGTIEEIEVIVGENTTDIINIGSNSSVTANTGTTIHNVHLHTKTHLIVDFQCGELVGTLDPRGVEVGVNFVGASDVRWLPACAWSILSRVL